MPEHPDRCTVFLRKGEPSPFSGVVLTVEMAAAIKTGLDECIAKLEENQAYCKAQVALDRLTAEKREQVIIDSMNAREKILKDALQKERSRGIDENAAGKEDQIVSNVLWGGGGVVVGALLAGAAVITVIVVMQND